MLSNKSIPLTILFCLLSVLTACSNQSLETIFAPDPKLKQNSELPSTPSTSTDVRLSESFPQDIPLYPQAKLLSQEAGSNQQQGKTLWQSSDPINLVQSYYNQQFESNNWVIQQPFTEENNTLIARRDDLEVKITLNTSSNLTDLAIEYQRQPITESSPPQQTPETVNQPTTPETPTTPKTPSNTGSFSDLNDTPVELKQFVEDLAALGVLTPANTQDPSKFEPNKTITHREYARWLVTTKNKLYNNIPGKQIRLAQTNTQPAFNDVPASDPDFPYIQGLAEAGVIPSPLSGDSNALTFRPDAPLTRENLIEWKVPLDLAKALPTATLDAVKETWGFQDAAKIDSKAWRSLYADFQNGDNSNIRRVFGLTTLFQPKKPVTRAEAAAAIWYFGFQGEGMSAKDVLPSSQ